MKDDRLNSRLGQERGERFAKYLEEHGLPESEAVRIAIDRLTQSKPKKSERHAAKLKEGRKPKPKDN